MKRFLALGDSYTIGESVPEEERWPVQLAASLQEASIPVDRPQIVARTGWTTAELSAAIAAASIDPPYDLVSLLIGVNNQYRGYSLEEYRVEFAALLAQAIEFAGDRPEHVLVLSIPDWGMTPFAERDAREPALITSQIVQFNAVNFDETQKLGAVYVDIFPISQQAYADEGLIAGDQLHPSGVQYRLWAEAAFPAALNILR